jgi:hypothetical protein
MSAGARHLREEGFVPNAPLREAVERRLAEGDSYGAIAIRVGWLRSDGRADITRLKRCLGISPMLNSMSENSSHRTRTTLTASLLCDTAVRICIAAGYDPVELGL